MEGTVQQRDEIVRTELRKSKYLLASFWALYLVALPLLFSYGWALGMLSVVVGGLLGILMTRKFVITSKQVKQWREENHLDGAR